MPRIRVSRGFSHAQHIYPVDIPPGEYAVGGSDNPEGGEICSEAARVAVEEGWGAPLDGEAEPETARPGRQSLESGEDKPPSSSRPARRSRKKTSKPSGAARE